MIHLKQRKELLKNLRRLSKSSVICLCCRKGKYKFRRWKIMKKKVLCTAMAVTILLTQTASAAPWQWHRNEVIYDSEIGFFGNVTLTFASDGGSFIRPITKRYGESISLESYVPAKYGYTFKGWFIDPRTKQNQVTTFKFTKPDVLYAKWRL